MKGVRTVMLGLVALVLAGCEGSSDFADLRSYMDEVRARPKGKIEPLPEFQPYEAFTYRAAALRSPFQPPLRVSTEERQKGNQDVRPDESRPREPLEAYSIDEFSMVGILARQGTVHALVRCSAGVYRVKVGDYLGRNHGRITRIDAGEVELVEIVPDGEGGWLERPRTLPLRERS